MSIGGEVGMAGEWVEMTVWELAEYVNGRATKPSEVCSNGVPVIKIAELNRGITHKTGYVSPAVVESKHWIREGDLLFAWSGSVAVSKYSGPKAALNQHIFRVTARPSVDQEFLRYLLSSLLPIFSSYVEDKKTTMGHVTTRDLQKICVMVPPLPEQRAIAHILGALDDKIELNRRMNQTLEAMARALFNSWFVDFEPVRAKMEGRWRRGESLPGLPAHLYDLFPDRLVESELGEIPEGWEIVCLGDCTNSLRGRSYRSEELAESDTALVTLKSFARGGGYKADGLKSFVGTYAPEQVVSPGELVIACTDVSQAAEVIGRPAVVRGASAFSTLVASLDVLIVRPTDSTTTRSFLYSLMGTDEFVDHMYAYTSGTTVLHLAREAMPSFRFVRPTAQILGTFDSLGSLLLNRIETSERELEALAALRDTLLPKLISGELRVRDAERFLAEAGV